MEEVTTFKEREVKKMRITEKVVTNPELTHSEIQVVRVYQQGEDLPQDMISVEGCKPVFPQEFVKGQPDFLGLNYCPIYQEGTQEEKDKLVGFLKLTDKSSTFKGIDDINEGFLIFWSEHNADYEPIAQFSINISNGWIIPIDTDETLYFNSFELWKAALKELGWDIDWWPRGRYEFNEDGMAVLVEKERVVKLKYPKGCEYCPDKSPECLLHCALHCIRCSPEIRQAVQRSLAEVVDRLR